MRKTPEFTMRGAPAMLALACSLGLWAGAAAASPTPLPAAQTVVASAGQTSATGATVYRCVAPDGKVQYSDTACPAGSRGSAWTRSTPAQGIVAARGARPGPEAHALLAPERSQALAGPSEPWVDCRQRGGSFDANARVCRLPADTVPHMFLAD